MTHKTTVTNLDAMMNRRDVLNLAVAAGSASTLLASSDTSSGNNHSPALRIVDTNVTLFHWPFCRLPLDETDVLVTKLRALGVVQGWAGSFEGVLHRDMAGVNQRLADKCRPYAELIPIGAINPMLPDWEHDLNVCVEQHQMSAIRLYPNYHGYELTDLQFRKLLTAATARGMCVQLVAAIEDQRTQHSGMHVPDVDLTPLADVLPAIPGIRLQILNHRSPVTLQKLASQHPGVCFDTARVDGTDAVPQLFRRLPKGRLLFGSHSPFLIPEASLVRVHESGGLNEAELRSVFSKNAELLIGGQTV